MFNSSSLVQWTNDESIFGVLVTNEILFFEKTNPGFFDDLFFQTKYYLKI